MSDILIVDDSREVRLRLIRLLKKIQHVRVCGEAESVSEGIDAIQLLSPNTVILDIGLNQGSGIQILEYFKNQVTAPRFIILTNYTAPQLRARCLNMGAAYFFDKSNEFEKVVEVLQLSVS